MWLLFLTVYPLITTIAVFNLVYSPIKSLLLGMKINVCLDINICKCLISDYSNMSNFDPLEVVSRSSETQFQAGGNLKYFKGLFRWDSHLEM